MWRATMNRVELIIGLIVVVLGTIIIALVSLNWFYDFLPKSNFLILIAGTIASIAVYVILLYYTGYVNQEDINILKNARTQS